MKRGIILAGGNGTRLRPLTNIINKHLLAVYKKPMVLYPLETLKSLGCTDILIVTGGNNIGGFADLLGDGSEYGVNVTYKAQKEAGGIAQALLCAEDFIGNSEELFPVILGDNYFDLSLDDQISVLPITRPTIFVKEVEDAKRFGVLNYEKWVIDEKPEIPQSNKAVTGLYIYNTKAFEYARMSSVSARGELEITSVNNHYLEERGADVIETFVFWSDMGTFESKLKTENFIANKLNGTKSTEEKTREI